MTDWPGDAAPLPHQPREDRLGARLAGMVAPCPRCGGARADAGLPGCNSPIRHADWGRRGAMRWVFVSPKRRAAPTYVRRARPFGNVAPHIRGRVFRIGPQWHFEVINSHTGRVLASDDCRIYEAVADACEETVAAARAAWFWDFKHKAVQ